MSLPEAFGRILESATSDSTASPSLADLREVGAALERARVSVFAAYKPFGSLPDQLTERLTEGL